MCVCPKKQHRFPLDMERKDTAMTTITPITPTKQAEDFEDAVRRGYEMYEEHAEAGDEIKNLADVWAFLERNLSPQTIERDAIAVRSYKLPGPTLHERVGFLVGYLTRAVTDPQE